MNCNKGGYHGAGYGPQAGYGAVAGTSYGHGGYGTMAGTGYGAVAGAGYGGGHGAGYGAVAGAGYTSAAPTTVASPIVSPTQNIVNTNVQKTIVPHIHPTHTTQVNKHCFQHQHYFPHTQSCVNECYSQQLVCGCPPPCPPPNPCCGPRRFGF